MPRTLYSPRLSDDVVRALYREGLRRKMPMTRLADELLRQALGGHRQAPGPNVLQGAPDPRQPRAPARRAGG